MSTVINTTACECVKSGIRLKWRNRSTESGFENPWGPDEITFVSVSGSAGDTVFLFEAIENFHLNMMITGLVDTDAIFPPNTYISFIDLDGGTFTTSAPALIDFTEEDLTVGLYYIKEWIGDPGSWYDLSQGDGHGLNGLVSTTRSAADSFQECQFELKLIGGQATTDITADWIRSDTSAVVSALETITLEDTAPSSGVLDAEIPPDETIYSGMYLGNITFRISPYRNV